MCVIKASHSEWWKLQPIVILALVDSGLILCSELWLLFSVVALVILCARVCFFP